jgi:pimeloyl-ACP methyl ester carboxylesterase
MFLHGWGLSARYWDEFIDELDLRSWRAITIDFPGHGASALGPEYDLPQLARELFVAARAGPDSHRALT